MDEVEIQCKERKRHRRLLIKAERTKVPEVCGTEISRRIRSTAIRTVQKDSASRSALEQSNVLYSVVSQAT